MTSYTIQQRILIIELCHENRRSMKSIFRKFHKLYGLYNRRSVEILVGFQKFQEIASVENKKKIRNIVVVVGVRY